MICAAATAPAVHHGLQYYAFTIMVVALAVLLVLFCIYWGLKCWEARRIIAHYQREERAEKVEQQRRKGAKQNGGAK